MSNPILLFLLTLATCEHRHSNSNADHAWIDPLDPTQHGDRAEMWADPLDPSCKDSHCLISSAPAVQAYGSRADSTIKRIINTILYDLNINPQEGNAVGRTAKIYLDTGKLARISTFLEAKTENDWLAHQRLCEDLEGVFTVVHEEDLSSWSFARLISAVQPYIITANLLVLFPAGIFLMRILFRARSLLLVMLVCFFGLSIYSAYDREVNVASAIRMEDEIRFKDSCRPPTKFESFIESFQGLFWTKSKSNCRRYFESQNKSTFSGIELIEVSIKVIFNGIFAPIEVLGKKLNGFFISFYTGMPIPIAIISTVMLVVLLFFFMGYRIRMPFFAFEPHGDAPVIAGVMRAAEAVAGAAAEALLPQQLQQRQPRPIVQAPDIEEIE